jgi:hypothetical protein
LSTLPIADIHIAREKSSSGDFDSAIGLLRAVLDGLFDSGGWIVGSELATRVFVETLLQRGCDGGLGDAQTPSSAALRPE